MRRDLYLQYICGFSRLLHKRKNDIVANNITHNLELCRNNLNVSFLQQKEILHTKYHQLNLWLFYMKQIYIYHMCLYIYGLQLCTYSI